MVNEDQKTVPEGTEVPSDSELFAGEVREELSERDVFVGDENFYKTLADSIQPAIPQSRPSPIGVQSVTDRLSLVPVVLKRFSTIRKVLAGGIVVAALMLLYALLIKSPPRSVTDMTPATTDQITPVIRQVPLSRQPIGDDTSQLTVSGQQKIEPISLKTANTFFLKADYDNAYAAYDQLRQSLGSDKEVLQEFLLLKMAFCMEKAADFKQAGRLFWMVSKGRSPVVRILANYHYGLLEIRKGQYLQARTRAYQAVALVDAVDFNSNWALALQRNCRFLIAESITREVLSLCDADKDLPGELWSSPDVLPDPFTDLSESQLWSFLNSGSDKLSKGLLAPRIEELEHLRGLQSFQGQRTSFGAPSRWSVICHGASIEELLARFSANSGLDIHWAFDSELVSEEQMAGTMLQRPVSLYLPETTPQQFFTVATGCVGLLASTYSASTDDKSDVPTVNIFNPAGCSSLSERISLLSREAVSLWQRFLLAFHEDEHIANAHFALGLLQAHQGRTTESIAEYKLVANRFSRTSLAPFALLHASKLKVDLHDYFGAREDLKQLVEQFPDAEISGRACLYLADATMKADLKTEAARLYGKVYHLDLSSQLRSVAALGAGRCFYELKDYQAAVKWLTRYINLAKDSPSRDLYSAYLLLGKANLALEEPQKACEAFQYALTGQLSSREYVETISALVKAQIQVQRFVEALNVLENVHSWAFSQKEFTEVLLLKSKILRTVGLVDSAIATIGDRAEYIYDPQLKAKTSFELIKCHIAKGNLELAHRKLTEILVSVEPGPLAHETAVTLADVSLKLGHNSQAISICLQLLELAPSAQIRQKTLTILATAHKRQKNYDAAVAALLGQWDGVEAR